MENNFITHNGKEYISVKSASRASGYARDYISRLCRKEKISGRLVGKNWFVDLDSLTAFAVTQKKAAEARSEELSRQSRDIETKINPGEESGALNADIRKVEPPVSHHTPIVHSFAAALAAQDAKSKSRPVAQVGDMSADGRGYHLLPMRDLRDRAVALALIFSLVFASLGALNPETAVRAFNETKSETIALAYSMRDAVVGFPSRMSTLAHADHARLIERATAPLTAWSQSDFARLSISARNVSQLSAAGIAQFFGGGIQSIGSTLYSAFGVITNLYAWTRGGKKTTVAGNALPPAQTNPSPAVAIDYSSILPGQQSAPQTMPDDRNSSTHTFLQPTIVERVTVQPIAAFGTAGFITRSELSGVMNQFAAVVSLLPRTTVTRELFTRQAERSGDSVTEALESYVPLSGGTVSGSLTVSDTGSFGLVGIGTTSPSDTFALDGAAFLGNISAPNNTSNRLYANSGDLYWAGNVVGGATTGNWTTDGANVWRASGNVGLATSSPTNRLEVAGNTFLGGNLTATGTLNILGASTLQSTLDLSGAITSTATAANTLPYASSTALTVSGTGYFGTASTTNLTVSALTSGRVPYITTAGAFPGSADLTF